jgi:hypothetical protein
MQASGRLALPTEILMIVAQHAQNCRDLVILCSSSRQIWSASSLLLSHWLQSRKLGTIWEVSERHALGFLHRHIHGKLVNHS